MLLLMLLVQDADVVTTAMTSYRERTRAEVRCRAPDESEEIIVCAAREGDRYRVPFVPAGRGRDSVPMRTAYLTQDHDPVECGQGAFMFRCGSVGVTMKVGLDGSVGMVERKLAP